MAFRFAALLALAVGLLTGVGLAQAQNYPTRPVTIVVPLSPGGPADLLGRSVAPPLAERWKQPVVVENRTGGGTLVGAVYVARSAPDGHTMLLIGAGVIGAKLFVKNPGVEPSDFVQVGEI